MTAAQRTRNENKALIHVYTTRGRKQEPRVRDVGRGRGRRDRAARRRRRCVGDAANTRRPSSVKCSTSPRAYFPSPAPTVSGLDTCTQRRLDYNWGHAMACGCGVLWIPLSGKRTPCVRRECPTLLTGLHHTPSLSHSPCPIYRWISYSAPFRGTSREVFRRATTAHLNEWHVRCSTLPACLMHNSIVL